MENKLNFIVLLIATSVFTSIIQSCSSMHSQHINSVLVSRRDVIEDIIFNANILPLSVEDYSYPLSGVIETIKKNPGEYVKKGEVVIELRHSGKLMLLKVNKNGTLLSMNCYVGQKIKNAPNEIPQKLFTIGDVTKKIIIADIDKLDASKLKKGDSIYTYPTNNNSISGTIDIINLLANEANKNHEAETFKIYGHLNDASNIFPFYGISIPIKVSRIVAKRVLTIENECTYKRNEDNYVTIIINDKREERKVITGCENELYTEIKSGIKEGQIIQKY